MASDSQSPSLLQSLKRFRFQKKTYPLYNENDDDNESGSSCSRNGDSNSHGTPRADCSESSDEKIINRKKRKFIDDDNEKVAKNVQKVYTISDSDDSEEIDSFLKNKKFKRLKFFSDSENSFNCDKKNSDNSPVRTKKLVQKDVTHFFGDKGKTNKISDTSNGCSKPDSSGTKKNSNSTSSSTNHGKDFLSSSSDCEVILSDNEIEKKVKKKKKKKKKKSKNSEDESDGGLTKLINGGTIYDSGESDDEITDELFGMKKEVFEFLNKAPIEELKEIKCTEKKIQALTIARPFASWRDLVFTCEANKGLGTDILEAAKNLLLSRKVLSNLMKKCKTISKKTERAVANGQTNIKSEPPLLDPNLKLKPYQMVGLNWLAVMHSQQLSGILADEMGLGKTIQVIAFLAHLKENGYLTENQPTLIIVPTSTLDNWYNEFEKWCPSLKVARYYGSMDERKKLRVSWIKYGFDDIDVVLSTYHIVSGAYEDKKLFKVVDLYYAVFDEGHMLKNMNTQRYESLIKINSKYKLLLTGTPIQNNLLELMSLLMFVMPKMFSNQKEFIKYLFERNTNKTQERVELDKENIEDAKLILKPFMLRRLKSEVLLELPTKTTEVIECPMVESQLIKYNELLKRFKNLASDKSTVVKVTHLSMFSKLRRLANHPLCLRYLYEDDKLRTMAELLAGDYEFNETDSDRIFKEYLYEMSDFEIHKLTFSYKCLKKFALPDSVFLDSGKCVKLDEILSDLKANNHRVLIFSQFVYLLDVYEEYLRIRGHTFLRIDGSTPGFERQQLINLYNMDPQIFIFLLTTKAGGMGINLTGADTAIINDLDFNPYNDKQAEDRCHRMGQTKDVKIIRLIAKDSVEEYIAKIAQEKQSLGQNLTADEQEENQTMASILHNALGLS